MFLRCSTRKEYGKEFSFSLRKDRVRAARQREGRYLLRRNMPERPAPQLWEFYLQLVQVEQAFKHLKGDLGLRPIYHQNGERSVAATAVGWLGQGDATTASPGKPAFIEHVRAAFDQPGSGSVALWPRCARLGAA